MSKYIVLYNWSFTKMVHKPAGHDEYFSWPAGTTSETSSGFAMKKFDDLEEAVKCANKNDGEILIPVQIKSNIEGVQ